MNKLDKVINQLKELSNGEVINVPLPDDNLLDDYEKNINFRDRKSVVQGKNENLENRHINKERKKRRKEQMRTEYNKE